MVSSSSLVAATTASPMHIMQGDGEGDGWRCRGDACRAGLINNFIIDMTEEKDDDDR